MRCQRRKRKAVTAVEAAFVYPVVFVLVLGVIVGAMGVFRYQQMASLARDAARYASVHGTHYAKDAGVTPPSPDDIYNTVVVPGADDLDLNCLSCSITYNTTNDPYHVNIENGDIVPYANTVRVTLTYKWFPEAFLVGPFSLSSTSEMPMSY